MICDNCGTSIEDGMRFCSCCGISAPPRSSPAEQPVSGPSGATDRNQVAVVPVPAAASQTSKAAIVPPVFSGALIGEHTATRPAVAGASKARARAAAAGAAALIAVASAVLFLWKPWVKPPLAIQSIEANKSRVQTGERVSLAARISGPDPNQLSYEWTTSSGSIIGMGTDASLDTSGSGFGSSSINVSLVVRDASGRSASAEHVIYVTTSPVATSPPTTPDPPSNPGAGLPSGPTASPGSPATVTASGVANTTALKNSPPSVKLAAGATRITQGEDVELIAEASDREAGKLSFVWNSSSGTTVGGGNRITLKTGSVEPGPVQVRVVVSDQGGSSATDSLTINVVPRPTPAPSITRLDVDHTRVAPGEKVTFKVYPAEPSSDLTYRWSASAGSINYTGASAVLDTSGLNDVVQITVTATVRDSQGRTAAASKYVAIAKPVIGRVEGTRRPDPVSASASKQGDDLVVTVSGSPASTGATSGAIEVTVLLGGVTRVFGYLPTGDCRWNLVAGENTKAKSLVFQDVPGPYNRFSRLSVRLRVNNERQPVHFTITWRLL
ncbi:MAG TPA: hypothetical protein VN937_17600 [Blastocatellia bacterium]|nr:hypothetical protein [Blastocatellia bacterium]